MGGAVAERSEALLQSEEKIIENHKTSGLHPGPGTFFLKYNLVKLCVFSCTTAERRVLANFAA